jgi:hypothetical protein
MTAAVVEPIPEGVRRIKFSPNAADSRPHGLRPSS